VGTDELFESKGCGVLPNFLEAQELRALACPLAKVLSLARQPCMSRPGNDLIPLRWNDAITERILSSERRIQRLQNLLKAPDLKWLSGYISTKPAQNPPLWWHQDWWCWVHPISFRPDATQVAVLCYLTDTNPKNGALRVLPGSHLTNTPLHRVLPEPHGEGANSLPTNHPAMADYPGQETLSVKGGDAVVIDYRLLHGTHANESLSDRDCILLSFIPNWRSLPTELKAHLIAHPALPDETEVSILSGCAYDELFPQFDGAPASFPVTRLRPATLALP
jgi:hypothetical protein